MIRISPSLLASDFTALGAEAAAMERAGADWLHVDVMDGHFVPNITIGPPVVAALRKKTRLPLDVHLMITDPAAYAGAFAQAGADLLTFHLEAAGDPAATIARLRALGCRVGISLKPATPAEAALPYLSQVDLVLVMTVEPGFGGQEFMPAMLGKIRALRRAAEEAGLPLELQVDGGIGLQTAGLVTEAGANVLVAGTALFSQPDYGAAVAALRRAARPVRG